MSDPIREFLKKRGSAEHVVKGGLKGLVETWETIATEVSHGYDLSFEDYLNDMDLRQLIEEAAPCASTPAHKALLKKVGRIDAIMKTLIQPSRKPLWGEATSAERGWTPEHNWWYFTVPKNPGPDLRDELDK